MEHFFCGSHSQVTERTAPEQDCLPASGADDRAGRRQVCEVAAVKAAGSPLSRDIVTVLFTDIEGFTRLTEALPLERTAAILAQYYDALLEVAAQTCGTVDGFNGDGAMLYWSRARNGAGHADLAVRGVARLREVLARQGSEPGGRIASGLPVRFGLHTGEVMLGQIGEGAMSLTLVGDVVNVAFRLQQAAKSLPPRPMDGGLRGYVSRETTRHLGAAFAGEAFEALTLPGRKRAAMAARL